MAQRQDAVLDEALIGEVGRTDGTVETSRMVIAVDRLDHLASNELLADRALRREQHVEIVLAIFATLELEKLIVLLERPEALRTDKAVLVPHLGSCLD